ncbi:MAG: hypothetical protein ACKPKO_00845, partial [Candidatus Fonsibacter sp.]
AARAATAAGVRTDGSGGFCLGGDTPFAKPHDWHLLRSPKLENWHPLQRQFGVRVYHPTSPL